MSDSEAVIEGPRPDTYNPINLFDLLRTDILLPVSRLMLFFARLGIGKRAINRAACSVLVSHGIPARIAMTRTDPEHPMRFHYNLKIYNQPVRISAPNDVMMNVAEFIHHLGFVGDECDYMPPEYTFMPHFVESPHVLQVVPHIQTLEIIQNMSPRVPQNDPEASEP